MTKAFAMTNYSSATGHDLFLYLKGVSANACVCHLIHDIILSEQKKSNVLGFLRVVVDDKIGYLSLKLRCMFFPFLFYTFANGISLR